MPPPVVMYWLHATRKWQRFAVMCCYIYVYLRQPAKWGPWRRWLPCCYWLNQTWKLQQCLSEVLSCYLLNVTENWITPSHVGVKHTFHCRSCMVQSIVVDHAILPPPYEDGDFLKKKHCRDWHLLQCGNVHIHISLQPLVGPILRYRTPLWVSYKGMHKWSVRLFCLEDYLTKCLSCTWMTLH